MKAIAFFVSMLFPCFSYSSEGYSIVLSNSSMLIMMDMKCSPCDIECNKITYRMFDTYQSIQISGKADSLNAGVNRNFVGYRLLGHKESYRLSASAKDNVWDLYTESNGKVISKSQVNTVYDDGTC